MATMHQAAAELLEQENNRKMAALQRFEQAQQQRQQREDAFHDAAAAEDEAWRDVQQCWPPKLLQQLGVSGPRTVSRPKRGATKAKKSATIHKVREQPGVTRENQPGATESAAASGPERP